MPLSVEFWSRPSKMGHHPSILCVASEDELLALDNAENVSRLIVLVIFSDIRQLRPRRQRLQSEG